MRHFRLAHFQFRPFVNVGDRVLAGRTRVGTVGSTGVSTGPHVHLDGTHQKPVDWHQYKSRPFNEYFDTAPWAENVLPYEGRYLTNRHSPTHRGVDINVKPEDLGLPAYSPVNGVVVYVEPPVSVYRLMRGIRVLFQPTYGEGFGNFLWIEETGAPETEINILAEIEKHPSIAMLVKAELPTVVDALDHLGYSMTDILNSYTNKQRTGKHIFDLTKKR